MRLLPVVLLVAIGVVGFTFPAMGQGEYTADRLLFTAYLDGSVQVDYVVSPDPIFPSVNVTLFGKIYENLLIQNENKTLLDFRATGGPLTVFSLGSEQVSITYSTQDLVNKSGRIWTFSVSSPIDFSITFPREATIISLKSLPRSITTQGGQTSLLMQEGSQEIGYITGILGTEEVSNLLINKAKSVIEEGKSQNIVMAEAEEKLAEAENAFRSQNYLDAERLATAAIDIAAKVDLEARLARESIQDAQLLVGQAENEGRTIGLDDARRLIQDAVNQLGDGKYGDALRIAQQASTLAQGATRSSIISDASLPAAVAGGAVVTVIAAYYLKRRRMVVVSTEGVHERQVRKIDVSKILDAKPYLRAEDREIVQVLAEMGGEGFESELRERFKFPKTTMWRTVKRLQREGIAEVVKMGGQNLIRLKEPAREEGA